MQNVKHLYITPLHERKVAKSTLQLRNTDVEKDWWSKEKAWTLGSDLPEQGARHIPWEAWNRYPKEEVAVGPDWANSTATIHGHNVEEVPTMQFGTPLLPPRFDDVEADRERTWQLHCAKSTTCRMRNLKYILRDTEVYSD